jgi:tRNA(Leu) C34 or U34 (ribose-2'-O)-methylase TrmL
MQVGKKAPPSGVVPSIVLVNPKFAHNVGMTVRLASCYGFKQVWFTGDRVRLEIEQRRRVPREERMRGYRDVDMISFDRPLEVFPPGVVPVAVELRQGSERLDLFEHPDRAVYVFGPEDGSVPSPMLAQCHRFVVIPTRHCLNLATAVSTVLYDRAVKLGTMPTEIHGEDAPRVDDEDPMGLFSARGEV